MKQSIRIVGPAVAVLLIGFLVWTSWLGRTADTATSQTTAGRYLVRLVTDTVSINDVVTLDITESAQPAALDSVSVEPVMTAMGHALPPVVAARTEPGTYRAQPDFFMAGQWEITVRITVSDPSTGDDHMTAAVLLLTVVG